MTKIVGLDKLQRKLSEARRAANELNGDLGAVEFNPRDAASIEAAIQSADQLVEDRARRYASNPFIAPLIEHIKTASREDILQRAAKARIEDDKSE
ncbi:hypothetical protein P7L78_23590 [Tistrella bauzanensis]|jgi:hypothetical protein|uniref:hypothetical protein n=1 Tax=Tistrella TaxID=171436 RepID=UPI0031F667FC